MTFPLDSFRRALGYNPWHFWGWDTSAFVPMTSACNGLVAEYAWQMADAAGRDDIRRAIQRAEERLRNLLGYRVGPQFVSVTVPFPKLRQTGLARFASFDARARRFSVDTREGYIRAVGVQTRLLLNAAAAVVYSDEDGDGLDETFTVTTPTGGLVTDPGEVAVYFAAADRLDGESVSERWRIAPVKVTISAGVITIVGRAWMLGEPILYQGLNAAQGLDPTVAANFVGTVEVYRLYARTDGQAASNSQAVLIWETPPVPPCAFPCSSNPNTGSDPATEYQAAARCGVRDARLGSVTPGEAVLNTNGTWSDVSWGSGQWREPDRVKINLLVGAPLEALDGNAANPPFQGIQDIQWDLVITRLAAAEMARRICACESANQEMYRWQFDLSRAAGANDEQYSISPEDLNNPLGTRAGEVYAWKQVKFSYDPPVILV